MTRRQALRSAAGLTTGAILPRYASATLKEINVSEKPISVDVLIVGAGVQGLALARALKDRYALCVAGTGMKVSETLHSHGFISSGYYGNNLERIQATRAVGANWKDFFDEQRVPYNRDRIYYVMPEEAAKKSHLLWDKAKLPYRVVKQCPEVFKGGLVQKAVISQVFHESVVTNQRAVEALRKSTDRNLVLGEVTAIHLDADKRVEGVQIKAGDRVVGIQPRFLILCAGAGNATLLQKTTRTKAGRQVAAFTPKQVNESQSLRTMYMLCARGKNLPLISGGFLDTAIISHKLDNTGEVIWLITYNPEDEPVVDGAVNMNTDPKPDLARLQTGIEKLQALIPNLNSWAKPNQWAHYIGWKAESPIIRRGKVPLPLPIAVNTFDLTNFAAVWPGHWGHAVEAVPRIEKMLAKVLKGGEKSQPFDRTRARLPGHPATPPCKYESDRIQWHRWSEFKKIYRIKI